MNTDYYFACSFLGILAGIGLISFPRFWAACTLLATSSAFLAALSLLTGGPDWEFRPALSLGGEPILLRLDAISAFFFLLLTTVASAGTLYGNAYWPDAAHPRSAVLGRLAWNAMLLGMGVVLLAGNGLHFLLGWEVFAVSAFFLVCLERGNPEARAAGWLYLAASHAGTLSLFAFFTFLATATGSWELGPMLGRPELAPLFWLACLGFGIKAGVFPMHIWLPSAHASAPSHVSALLSGVAIKIGIFGLVRFSAWMPMPLGASWVIAGLGCGSAVLGVVFALGQHDLKRLLAYHSVENIGIILMGLGFALIAREAGQPHWGMLALAGGLLHVWNHGLFKALLFFGAGSVLHATGTREMSRLGGLARSMPWTAGLFTLGSVAICGLPPLNGFVSEWLVYRGLLGAAHPMDATALAAVAAAVLLAVTGALALACFVKVCGVVFLGAPRSDRSEHARECPAAMRSGMLVLAAGCLAIGLSPAAFWPLLAKAARVWSGGAADMPAPDGLAALGMAHLLLAGLAVAAGAACLLLLRGRITRDVTWDCGFVRPTARMQYTAGSFAEIITAWFAWILRPETHQIRPTTFFPVRATEESHTPETVLQRVVVPAAGRILCLADWIRGFQHGRVQSYIAYICAAILVLGTLVALARMFEHNL